MIHKDELSNSVKLFVSFFVEALGEKVVGSLKKTKTTQVNLFNQFFSLYITTSPRSIQRSRMYSSSAEN